MFLFLVNKSSCNQVFEEPLKHPFKTLGQPGVITDTSKPATQEAETRGLLLRLHLRKQTTSKRTGGVAQW
jgi:hypothetical protein